MFTVLNISSLTYFKIHRYTGMTLFLVTVYYRHSADIFRVGLLLSSNLGLEYWFEHSTVPEVD